MTREDNIDLGLDFSRNLVRAVSAAEGNGQNLMLSLQYATFATLMAVRHFGAKDGHSFDVHRLNEELYRNVKQMLIDALADDMLMTKMAQAGKRS